MLQVKSDHSNGSVANGTANTHYDKVASGKPEVYANGFTGKSSKHGKQEKKKHK